MIAAQLYTVRDHTKTAKDFVASMKKISEIGYTAVQLSAVGAMNEPSPEVTATEAKKILDDNGLKAVVTHRDWNGLANKTDSEIEFHHILDCPYAAIGGLPGEYGANGLAGYSKWVVDALPVVQKLKTAGIAFGYHNHHHEFEKIGLNRTTPYDVIIVEGAPDIFLELDIYWAQHAGLDPVVLIEKLPGRLPVVHLKDKEVTNGQIVMAPVGEGNLDWLKIIPALKIAGTKWICVEQDECYRDPFDCLKSSFDFLSS